jgi:hypothetical protein
VEAKSDILGFAGRSVNVTSVAVAKIAVRTIFLLKYASLNTKLQLNYKSLELQKHWWADEKWGLVRPAG